MGDFGFFVYRVRKSPNNASDMVYAFCVDLSVEKKESLQNVNHSIKDFARY